jgi:hypothetical protein
MGSSSLARKIGVVSASAVAASLIAAGGSAQAATRLSITSTKAPGATTAAKSVAKAGAPAASGASVTFTPKRKPGQVGPMPAYACVVAYPVATVTQFHQTSWSGGTQCNITLRQQGTTVLFQWGSNQAYAFGTSYDNFATAEMSTGGPVSTSGGQWAVNNNVLFFSPAGYTSTPNGGCAWFDTAHTQIKCTITTGPFTG